MHTAQSPRSPQEHASGSSSSHTARQRSASPIKQPSRGPSRSPVYNRNRALDQLHSDSPTSNLPSPAKRPRSSLPSSSFPPSTYPEVITIDTSSEADVEMDEPDNDENAAPEGEQAGVEEDEQMGGDDEEEVEEGIDREEGVEGEGGESEEDLDDEEDEDDEDEDEDDDDDAGSEDLEIEFVSMRQGSGPPKDGLVQVKAEPDEPAAAGPSIIPADGPAAEGPVTTLVAKKKKVVRVVRSPSEERPPPPPLDTIRLSHVLVPGETLEWNVLASAQEAGLVMRRWNPDVQAEVKPEVADGAGEAIPKLGSPVNLAGETEDEKRARELDEKYAEVPKKKKKPIKRKPLDYDDTDPFIDDSELQQDAPTHMARTVKQGFFVQMGKVEVLEEEAKPAAKPRASAAAKRAPRSSQAAPPKPVRQRKTLAQLVVEAEAKKAKFGTSKTPIKIDSDDEDDSDTLSPFQRSPSPDLPDPTLEAKFEPVLQVERSRFIHASRDAACLPPWPEFPKPLRLNLLELRKQSLAHVWDPNVKAKFPDTLKPALEACGFTAMRHNLFPVSEGGDTRFYTSLPAILPYNCFTLTKLVTKLCFQDYCDFLDQCEKAGLDQFAALVKRDAPEWKRKYAEAMKEYEEEKRKWEESHPSGEPTSSALTTLPNATVRLHPLADVNADSQNMTAETSTDHPEDAEDKPPAPTDGVPKEPIKRFVWNSEMRDVFVQLLENLQEGQDLNAKAEDFRIPTDRTGKEWTDLALRAVLYKKIIECFPEGYMTSPIVSREMSKIKQRKKTIAGKEKQAA